MKNNNLAVIILLLLPFVLSCTSPSQPVTSLRKDFHLPFIVQAPAEDTIEYQKIDCTNRVYFSFAGKSKFTDTLLLDKEGFLRDTIAEADILWEQSRPGFRDSLSTDGFQIFPDYNTSIHYKRDYYLNAFCNFPVYVVNETSSTKVFFEKDAHVFGIQEAIDASDLSDEWRPIEAQGFDFCGNGYSGIKVHPGEFVMFLVPKYQGEEKNAMRIRLEIGESLYISRSYEGTFNASQFNITELSGFHNLFTNKKRSIPHWVFYGAIPKGYDPE